MQWKTTLADLFAEVRFHLTVFLSCVATVAAIVITPCDVVAIVAIAVSLVVRLLTAGRLRVTLVIRVQAFALQT